MNTKIVKSDEVNAITHARDILLNGGVVAFPTDTVYGLAALVTNEEAVSRLYAIKGRQHTKAIAVLMSHMDKLDQVALHPSKDALKLAFDFWPGPLTLIVPRHPRIPGILSPLPTIGVRVPNHAVALELLAETGPLGVTSANITGGENTTTAAEVLAQLNDRIHLILDGGKSPGGIPSTVVDMTAESPVILRQGPITEAQIQATLA
ncbi:MAG: threonylcarbamoyl-AMP synthase [Anaerolineales bacterium]|nr:threonylcarbamoyl-AMP synthase [Anaerolineales bacterium]